MQLFDAETENKSNEIYDINGNLLTSKSEEQTLVEDIDLIQRAINGEKAAFDDLYMQSYRYVFFVVRQYIPDDETTYDAIQETFIKVYKNIHTLASAQAFLGWISTIAKNTAIDILRTAKYKTTEAYDENEITLAQDEKNTEVVLDVETVLRKLSPQDSEIISLVYYDGMRVSQIAKMQGVPATTVYSRLNKAKKNLKAQLAVHGIDKAVYSGNFVAMITTAIRNIIGTALLSFAIAQQILNSITGKHGKKELAIANIIKSHQKKLALKIASWLVAVSIFASCFTVLTLTDWGRNLKQKVDNTVKETVETITEYHYYDEASSDTSTTSSENTNGGFWQNLFGNNSSKNDTESNDSNSSTSGGFWQNIFGNNSSKNDAASNNSSSTSSAQSNNFWENIFGGGNDKNTSSDEVNTSREESSVQNTTSENESSGVSSDNSQAESSSSAPASVPSHTVTPDESSEASSNNTPSQDVSDGFEPDCDVSQYNILGNQYSNANVAMQGDWIYYCSATYSEEGGLYKIKNDGTGKQLLKAGISSRELNYINVVGEWIYYISANNICRIRTDGNGYQMIYDTDATTLQVYNNTGYFKTDRSQMSNAGFYTIDLETFEVDSCAITYFTDKYRIVLEYDYDGNGDDRYAIYSLKTGALVATISEDYGSLIKCYNSAVIIGGYVFDLNNLSSDPVYIYRDVKDYTKIVYFYSPHKGGCIGGWFGKIWDGYFSDKFTGTIYKSDFSQQNWPFPWECIENQVNAKTSQYAVFGDYIYYIEGTKLNKVLPDGTSHNIIG